MKLLVYF